MKKKLLVGLAAGLFLTGMVGVASATSLNILNHSFEDDQLAPGGWNFDVGSWDESVGGSAGAWSPAAGYFTPSAPDGAQVTWINEGSLSQTLSDILTADTQYTLQVDIGWRTDYSEPGYLVEFLAGSTVIASDSGASLSKGGWTTSTLSYFSSPSDTYLGQALGIRLSGTGSSQANFDNLRLDATQVNFDKSGMDATNPVPEPTTMLLFGTGLIGFAGVARRKKK